MYKYDFVISLTESGATDALVTISVKGRYIDDIRSLAALALETNAKIPPLKPKHYNSVMLAPPKIEPTVPTRKDIKELQKK